MTDPKQGGGMTTPPQAAELDSVCRLWKRCRQNTDWNECARVFAANGWTYGFYAGEHVPDAKELRRTANELFVGALRTYPGPGPHHCASGRLIVAIVNGKPLLASEALDPDAYRSLAKDLGLGYLIPEQP